MGRHQKPLLDWHPNSVPERPDSQFGPVFAASVFTASLAEK